MLTQLWSMSFIALNSYFIKLIVFHLFYRDSNLHGYHIPAGTHILPNLYSINMDPNLWDEPEKFEPKRFLKNGKVFKPDHFIPFSVGKSSLQLIYNRNRINQKLKLNFCYTIKGRRMCLGDVLTKMEVFLFLSSLLQQFNLCVPHNEEPPLALGIVAASVAPKPFQVCAVHRNKSQ